MEFFVKNRSVLTSKIFSGRKIKNFVKYLLIPYCDAPSNVSQFEM